MIDAPEMYSKYTSSWK